MNIRCLIVDDDPLAIAVIKNYIGKVSTLELIGTCNSPVEAYDMLRENDVDLMFLDIEMPHISGIDFLKTLSNPPKVIITSGNKEYALEGFELNVLDYMIKPVSFERFFKAINKYPQPQEKAKKIITDTSQKTVAAATTPNISEDSYIYVKENKRMVKIVLKDILFIESIKDYVKIKTNEKTVVTKQQLSYLEEKLPKDSFLRIHRSLMVPISRIASFSPASVEINGEELPIGRSYKNSVMEVLEKITGVE